MNTIDYTKLKRQKDVVLNWKANDYIGTADLVMGFGKTFVGLLAIDDVIKDAEELSKIMIVVPSIVVKKRWEEDSSNIFKNGILDRDLLKEYTISLVTISELIKYNPDQLSKIKVDLLIVDEIHLFTGGKRKKLLSRELIKFDKRLGLTGSMPDGVDRKYIEENFPVFDRVDEKEAIEKGWISNFIEYNVPLQLSDKDKERYERHSVPISDILHKYKGLYKRYDKLFRSDIDFIISLNTGKVYEGTHISAEFIRENLAYKMGWNKNLNLDNKYDRDRDENWNPNVIYEDVQRFTEATRLRNDILINNDIKLDAAVEIFRHIAKPTICFNESTRFADRVANVINAQAGLSIATVYHSNIKSRPVIDNATGEYFKYGKGAKRAGEPKIFGKKSLREMAIEGMKNGNYLFLSTAKALDVGLDIPQLNVAITTAGTANPMQYKQRSARTKRVNIYDEEKVSIIINLYFDDFESLSRPGKTVKSRDKAKLLNRQKDNRLPVIQANSLTDLLNIL